MEKYAEFLQLVLGCTVFFLGAVLCSIGWRLYTAPSSRMARFIGDRLEISPSFLQAPGVIEMIGGGLGIVVGVLLIVLARRESR